MGDRTIGRAFSTMCRLSVCLSVCLSVTFCIVAKRYVLAKNCLKERIGNQGQRVDFLGCRRISTSGFAYMATETAVFAVRSAKPCFSWDTCCTMHLAAKFHRLMFNRSEVIVLTNKQVDAAENIHLASLCYAGG